MSELGLMRSKNLEIQVLGSRGTRLYARVHRERIDLLYRYGPAFVRHPLAGLELRRAGVMRDRRIGRMAVGEQDRIQRELMRPEHLPVEDDRAKEEEARD
jgi:hypothetical protein